jgi:hypothetical protein
VDTSGRLGSRERSRATVVSVVRPAFVIGQYENVSDLRDVDDVWLSGTNSRGRAILRRRDLVRATIPAA